LPQNPSPAKWGHSCISPTLLKTNLTGKSAPALEKTSRNNPRSRIVLGILMEFLGVDSKIKRYIDTSKQKHSFQCMETFAAS
jgi:hypothetical protein